MCVSRPPHGQITPRLVKAQPFVSAAPVKPLKRPLSVDIRGAAPLLTGNEMHTEEKCQRTNKGLKKQNVSGLKPLFGMEGTRTDTI